MKQPRWIRTRRARTAVVAGLLLGGAGVMQLTEANPAASQQAILTAYKASSDPGDDPAAGVWKDSFSLRVPLTAQAGAYAAGGGSVPAVSAKALHHEGKIYIRLEWADSSEDRSTSRSQDFADGAAIELPSRSAATVPQICMGQADGAVNIWHWRADFQDGIKDPDALYTTALVDKQESQFPVFYAAREAGNPIAQLDGKAAQTLVARAFGTIGPANAQDVQANAVYSEGRWAVVFWRQFEGADGDQATFAEGSKSDLAFAVWNGSEGERNGRKSVSQFVTLKVGGESPGGDGASPWTVALAAGILAAGAAGGIGIAAGAYRSARATR